MVKSHKNFFSQKPLFLREWINFSILLSVIELYLLVIVGSNQRWFLNQFLPSFKIHPPPQIWKIRVFEGVIAAPSILTNACMQSMVFHAWIYRERSILYYALPFDELQRQCSWNRITKRGPSEKHHIMTHFKSNQK